MGRITNTWDLMRASWGLLKRDKELLLFPVFSSLCALLVSASFALPLFFSGALSSSDGGATTNEVLLAVVAFLFYFCNYFVIVFFNSAIVACACIRMAGGDPTVADGFRAAFNRLPLIAGWAAVAATVGMILRGLEERSEGLGRFVSGLLGVAWTAASFFVVPILVIERKGPFEALKDSATLLKRTWGEQIVGHFSFGLVFGLLSLPAILLIVLGITSGAAAVMVVCVGIGVIGMLVLAVIHATLQTIFQAALYLYARDGQVPAGFARSQLEGAMGARY